MVEHYFSEKPHSFVKHTPFSYSFKNYQFVFLSAPSTFSIGKIDRGTEVLIHSMDIKNAQTILDIGCGIGVVGIIASRINPKAKITLADINERSLLLAEKNCAQNHCPDIKIIKSNLYDRIKESFDCILSNPPQKAGKKICFQLIEEAKEHMKKNGTLQIVARHQKGGKSLEQKMKDVFGNVHTLSRESGYRVYCSKNIS